MDQTGTALAFLLPVGAILAAWGGLPPERSRRAASVGLLALAVSAIAYAATGFAFQFGGIWHVTQMSAYRALDQFWSVPDPTGNTWSVLGLTGWMLAEPLGAEVVSLFLHYLPLVMAAVAVPMLALAGRAPNIVLVVVGLTVAAVIAPLLGHWAWAGGWLAALGQNLQLGHGYVDMLGGGVVYLASGLLALLGLRAFAAPRPAATGTPQLPEAHLPLLAVTGALMFSVGWMAWLAASPVLPGANTLDPSLAMTNGLLAAAAATLITQLFSWFAASHVDPLMGARGWLAGWVIASAGASFFPPWSALTLGVLAGVLVPILMYLMDHVFKLDDATAAVSIYAVPGLVGTLAVGLFADGRWGAGWNGIGAQEYLVVPGQGVTGLVAAFNYTADAGQLTAQLAGVGAITILTLVIGGGVLLATALIARAWSRRVTNGK